jgi:hypothetical protein
MPNSTRAYADHLRALRDLESGKAGINDETHDAIRWAIREMSRTKGDTRASVTPQGHGLPEEVAKAPDPMAALNASLGLTGPSEEE